MRKFGIRRALSTKSVPRSQDPEFVQEDVDEHGHVIVKRAKPQRNNSLMTRMFRKKSRHSEDLDTIHSGEVHAAPVIPVTATTAHGSEYGGHSFAGAGTQLMSDSRHDLGHRDPSIRDHHSVRDHSVRDHSVRDHSVRGHTLRDDRSRVYPEDYASTTGHTHHTHHTRPEVYERDYVRDEHYPHEHVTVVHDSPRHSPVTPHDYHAAPYSTTGGTVIHDIIRDDNSASGRSGRSFRSSSRGRNEVEVNLKPGEKQEFEIGPNTQLIVPDDVELEISDGKGGWLPYHESLLRRPPREEVYVISGGSNFIVEDEMGNVLHRSQPRTYSTAPVSVAGSVAGRSARSRRDDGQVVYLDS
ncbi:hypothetical protein FRC08_003897 [Ceratobasidium sp. 394]|nr:hypothetical protein FRC08_003897 [Ceratobasidium sp. 394]KAG9092641.1 hypothetical protein FS749_015551 [Ceratobasidium sp. UAMH 11750]